MKQFKAYLHVKSGAKPVFHRLGAVPYAIKGAIENELETLQGKVEHSEWAAPIVPILKGDVIIRTHMWSSKCKL